MTKAPGERSKSVKNILNHFFFAAYLLTSRSFKKLHRDRNRERVLILFINQLQANARFILQLSRHRNRN
jgi:hypothetical protein